MHHFVSTDLCIVAVFCTAPDFFFGFIKTFLTLTVNTASALGLADYDSPVFFYTYVPKSGGPGYRQAEQTVVNVYFANCIRQPERQLPRPI